MSQRQVADESGIPRSTLQHWLERRDTLKADPVVVAFFESPAGVAFLHRLVLAAHVVMTLVGPGGIRLVCLFLELTGLHVFVAASYGPQQKVSVAIEKAVVEFGQAEQHRLAQGMAAQQITVCQDETFHPETCRVAIEPVSNYILLEKYAENRKAETWTQSMAEATQGLPVELIQSTSDEGRGLRHHVEEDLGLHHSPDVFHVQQDVVQGSSVVLAHQKRQAEQAVAKAAQQVSRLKEGPSPNSKPDSPSDGTLVQLLVTAQAQEQKAREALETIAEQHQRVQVAVAGISVAYHLYDLETGVAQTAEQVADALAQHWSEIEAVAAEARLPERCVKKIQKAKRVVVELVATLAFFWLTVRAKVEALALAPTVEQAVYDNLIPAIYLHLVSEKISDPQQRQTLQTQSDKLLAPLVSPDGPWAGLEQAEVRVIETVALREACAQVFQRSSSCVEGRNGQLALRHHSLHRLTDRKLTALTTVHNYFIRRGDGTTAAERFFGAKPRDLFTWILERVDLPGWAAQKRSHPMPKTYLLPATT